MFETKNIAKFEISPLKPRKCFRLLKQIVNRSKPQEYFISSEKSLRYTRHFECGCVLASIYKDQIKGNERYSL